MKDTRRLRLRALIVVGIVAIAAGCESRVQYDWAFASFGDGTFKENETCRESLADTLANRDYRARLKRVEKKDVYDFRAEPGSLRIYAFKTKEACDVALGALKAKQKQP